MLAGMTGGSMSAMRVTRAALFAATLLGWLGGPGPAAAEEAFLGFSDGVRWGVEVVQTRLAAQQAVRWDYVVVLRETRGREVQLERIDIGVGDRTTRSHSTADRLPPHGELRIKHWDRSADGKSVVEVFRRYRGRDQLGSPVTLEVKLKLDSGVGVRPAAPTPIALPGDLGVPTPPDIRLVTPPPSTPPELAGLAGVWHGRWGQAGREALVVFEELAPDRPIVVAYAWGRWRDTESGWERLLAARDQGVLTARVSGGGRLTFRLEPSGKLGVAWRSGEESSRAVLTRLDTSPHVTVAGAPATADQATRLAREAWDALQDGRTGEALPKAQEALAMREQLLGSRSPAVGESLNTLGEVYRAQGQLDDAERTHRSALALRESVLGPQHLDVATTLNNMAMLNTARAAYVEAETLLKRAQAIVEASPPSAQRTRLQAEILESLARVYRGLGRIAEAQEAQARAMLLWTQ